MSRWAACLGVLAAAAGLGSCRQVVGITDQPPEALATTVCGLPYGTTACASCAYSSCCHESMACKESSTCAAYEGCFGPCNGDPTCWAQCMADYPATGVEVSALSACMATHCEGECGLTCGAFAGVPVSPGTASACQACLKSQACSETRACAKAVECDEFDRCEAACATFDCVDGCLLTQGGNPAWNIVPDAGNGGVSGQLNNARGQCMPACADWNCVGKVTWPHISVPTPYTFNFWVKDSLTSAFLPGLNVAMYGADDPDGKKTPFAEGVTDANGGVPLRFTNEGVSGSLDEGLDGFLKITAPGLTDNYSYWGAPLSGSQAFLYDVVSTAADYQTISTSVGIDPNLSRGWLDVVVHDCANYAAPNVQVTLDPAGDQLTQGFDFPSLARTTTTNQSGVIVFGAVLPGLVTVTATPPGLKGPSGTVSVTVHKGAATQVLLLPTP